MPNYTVYHLHTMLSNGVTNVDSITNYKQYVEAAKNCGMTALCFTEHGSIFEWVHKKEVVEAAGMKYIHAIEAYITEAISEEKIRDNYHCVLIAKNYDGVKELNRIISRSFDRNDGHFYYVPRLTMDELFALSDNIIITTACLGGVLNNGTPLATEHMLNFLRKNKNRCFLEIQHHNCKDQIIYNQKLYRLSQEIGVPLIAGTDTHALNDIHMDGRRILQKAKDVNFSNEDDWDMTFKSYDQLVGAYEEQNSLPMNVVLEAIENTNRMADMVEEFTLDHSAKYPKLYEDSEGVFKQKINEGVKWRKINKKPNYQEYLDRIHYEYDTYKHNGAIDFMLLEDDYKAEMRRKGIRYGYSRGSVSGSIIAYLLGITEIDSVKFKLNFERFMNKERISLADVDSDWFSEDRNAVREYLYTKPGLYCCDIVTFNTIALKGAVNDVCRAFHKENLEHLPAELKKESDDFNKANSEEDARSRAIMPIPRELVERIEHFSIHKEVPYKYREFSAQLNDMLDADEAAARKKYPDIFKYVDLLNGCVVSVGNHPAGCVVSPYPVDEWFGTFTTSTNEYPISQINMKEIDSLNFVKLDVLGLDTVGLVYKTCDLAGIPYLTPDNTPADDLDVWDSIKEDTTMIFQWESQSAAAYLKQLFSATTIAEIKKHNPNFSYLDLLSIGNGAIRPAGASYRDQLAMGIYKDNGNEALNKFLEPTLGFLVYQEQIIEFLHKFCGFTMGEADIVRRHFSKKTGTEKDIPIIKDGGKLSDDSTHTIKGFIQTMKDDYGVEREEAEKIIVDFLQVIQDASDYLFSKNHSDPYSWIGYICGYLRYHYPLEFVTTALNIFEGKDDKTLAIIDFAKRHGIRISPIKFRHSVAQYNCDKETNEIFKGISSIKFMNAVVANEMYELRNNQYESFIDLLYDLEEKTSLNSRQLRILIELDFFEEFGDANYLIKCANIFDTYNGKRQIKKQKLEQLGIAEDIVRPFAGKETEKMFSEVDMREFMKRLVMDIPYKKSTLGDKIRWQLLHLGYLDIANNAYSGMAVVVSLETKFSPRVKLHSLRNGTTLECKISKRVFNREKIKVGDIIRVTKSPMRNKMRRTDEGTFEPIPGQFERWIEEYRKVEI